MVLLHSVSGLLQSIDLFLYSIIMGVWLKLGSRLGVIFNLIVFSLLVTAKSSRSGFLFRSVGQYVDLPVDNILRLLFLMYFSGFYLEM